MRLRDGEDRRPDRGRYRRAAAEQGQGGAAAPVEPARHINVERRVDPGIAEQTDKQPVTDEQAELAAALRDNQTDRDHRRAEDHSETDAEPLGGTAHRDAAEGRAEPGERIGQSRHRALAAEIGGDRFEPDNRNRRRGERDRGDAERGQADNPRPARLDCRRKGRCGDDRRGNGHGNKKRIGLKPPPRNHWKRRDAASLPAVDSVRSRRGSCRSGRNGLQLQQAAGVAVQQFLAVLGA